MAGWKSAASWTYYTLGASYYLFRWVAALGVVGLVSVPFLPYRQYLGPVVFVVSLAVVVTAVGLWAAHGRRRDACVNPQIEIVRSKGTYHVHDGGAYSLRKELTIKALKTGAESLTLRYKWSGRDAVRHELSLPPNEATLEEGPGQFDTWDRMVVRFKQPLAKGSTRSLVLTARMTDHDGVAKPYYSTLTEDNYPNGITMCLLFDRAPKTLSRQILPALINNIPIKEEAVTDLKREYEWHIRRPRFGFRYRFIWEA